MCRSRLRTATLGPKVLVTPWMAIASGMERDPGRGWADGRESGEGEGEQQQSSTAAKQHRKVGAGRYCFGMSADAVSLMPDRVVAKLQELEAEYARLEKE